MSATPTPSPEALPIPEGVKHTPGPWIATTSNRGTPCIVSFEGDAWICGELANGNGEDCRETDGNIRLIAASPDLLDALRSVLPFLRTAEALWEDAPYPDVLASKLARAEAAIRLALTGER